MIINNKLCKITNGKNISFFASSENEMTMFIFTDITRKYILSKNNRFFRCLFSGESYTYHHVCKFNDTHLCVAFDNNMSIIYEKNN